MSKFYLSLCRYLMVLLMLVSLTATAQNRTVKGKVTSGDDGSAVPGVNIQVKGSGAGTVTDADGNYAIDVNSDAVLVFSFVGYASQEIAVGSQSVIDVVLQSDVTALSEVVVVGYGVQEKKDVTGVVAAVSTKDFNKGAIVSPDQLITGKVAGVQITQNSGEPGGQSTIRVRGGTSINASNEPLYVIDGVPIDNSAHNPGGFSSGRNPLNFINPADIETFTVLKDASAAAIYGSRAANGVIIITTKSGKAGKPTLTYDTWFSFGKVAKQLDVFNATQFRDLVISKGGSKVDLLGDANTDWQKQIFQRATGRSHTLTFSGGNDNTNYRFSLGFQEQDGIIKTSSTERINFSTNLNQKLLNDDLNISVNIKGSRTNDRYSPGVIGNAISFAPTQPIYDADSPWGGFYEWQNLSGTYDLLAVDNPVSLLKQTKEVGRATRSIGNIQFDYKIRPVPGLRANLNLGYDVANGDRRSFSPSTLINQASDSGNVRIENYTRTNVLLETYLAYAREIESIDGRFEVQGGYTFQDFEAEYPSLRAYRLTTDIFGYNNPSVGKKFEASNSYERNRLISFFGRANFSLKDKYMFTGTIRRDGSSRFGETNRWGIFPSAALAWRVIDEDFAAPLQSIFSDMKLRVGYGVNGNQEIGNFRYLSTYTPGTITAQYQFGNGFVSTIRPSGVDPTLKWEETTSLNIGLDFGVMEGRITGSLEYYQKNTKDLLFEVTVPAGSNLSNTVLTNIGEIKNSGIELSLNAVVLSKSDLSWNVGFNIASNRNEIITLDGNDDPNFKGYETGGISGGTGNNIQILRVGESVNSFYVYKHIMDNGKPRRDGVDYNEDGVVNLADMYADTNGDGSVNADDRRPFKAPAPKVLLGLTSQVRYKQFDLSFTLRANLGNYVYNNVASSNAFFNRVNETKPNNLLTSVLDTKFTTPQFFSDYYVENASFLRMDNLTIGYTAPKIKYLSSLRVYATGQNLFVLTDYSGLDPETNNGIDNNLYPRSRTFIVGLSLGF